MKGIRGFGNVMKQQASFAARSSRARSGLASASLFLVMFTVLGNGQAQAYVDPGTGSLVLQTIVAVLAGGLATFAGWRARLAQFIQRGKDEKR